MIDPISSRWLRVAGLVGAVGVALGAFGAHGLKERISADLLGYFAVGIQVAAENLRVLDADLKKCRQNGSNRW